MERLGRKRRVSARDISKVEAKGFGERWDVGDREKDSEVAILGSHVIETTWGGRRVGGGHQCKTQLLLQAGKENPQLHVS